MMGKRFYLYWNRHKLFGWEGEKSRQAVDAIVSGIKMRDQFRAVSVYQVDERTFSIVGEHYADTTDGKKKDGGHTRSKGHNVAGIPLLCEIETNRPDVMPGYPDPYGMIYVPDIVLVDDMDYYLMKKRWFPNYR